MKVFLHLTALAFCAAGVAHAAEPVTVLGIPLGGKISPSVRKCRDLSPTKYLEQSTCWVYSTPSSGGGSSGQLHIPGSDGRPAWAAYAEFKASINKQGAVTQLTVISRDATQAAEIIDSISSRFGRPTYSTLQPPVKWHASWDRPEIGISVLCSRGDKCYTRFTSAEVAAEERALMKSRAKVEAVRPASP